MNEERQRQWQRMQVALLQLVDGMPTTLRTALNSRNDFSSALSGFIPFEVDEALLETARDIVKNGTGTSGERRAIGCMLGMCIGDAIGAPLEFQPCRYDTDRIVVDMGNSIQGAFHLKPGQWTDDSSMGLCVADSLLRHPDFNPMDMMMRFVAWWNCGYNNAFGYDDKRQSRRSVGLGGNISQSFHDFVMRRTPQAFTLAGDKNTSGNGSVMRLAAVPIHYHNDLETAKRIAADHSRTTHQGWEAAGCCALMSQVIITAIRSTLPTMRNRPSSASAGAGGSSSVVTADAMVDDAGNNVSSSSPSPPVVAAASEQQNEHEQQQYEGEGGGAGGGATSAGGGAGGGDATKLTMAQQVLDTALKGFTYTHLDHGEVSSIRHLAASEMEGGDPDRDWRWRTTELYRYSRQREHQHPGYVGSYAMDATAMALHCVWSTTSFDDVSVDMFAHTRNTTHIHTHTQQAVLKAANMCGDSDSVASVTGQIAGAIYGCDGIPLDWVNAVQRWDGRGGLIALRALMLYRHTYPVFYE